MLNKTMWIKIIAVALIISLTVADLLLVGANAVTYAATIMQTPTSSENVTFDSYFKGDNGEEVQILEESVDSQDLKLYMRVAVKNEGYFNGQIVLGNSNFKLKEEVLSEKINRISGNVVYLNQINAGEEVEIEVKIEPVKPEEISSGYLSMPSELSIAGIYKNSSEKDININAQRNVTLVLTEKNSVAEVTSRILTNKIYEINGENKRVVQVLIESGINKNSYPIKETQIDITGITGAEKVEVIAREQVATNGKSGDAFNTSNWVYEEYLNKVKIDVINTEENGQIRWNKEGKDSYVITYILPEDEQVTGKTINVSDEITLYDLNSTVKTANTQIVVNNEIDGIIETEIRTGETDIYKGKIYAGETREYSTIDTIYVSNKDVEKMVNIEMGESSYKSAEGQLEASIQYLTSTINKAQIFRILGTEGYIKIGNTTITNDTNADEKGEITVAHIDGTKSVQVETSKVVETGKIEIKNTKAIKNERYSREQIRDLQGITEETIVQETNVKAEKIINLIETVTEANLEISPTYLTTLSKNENIEVKTILRTDNEKYDLYKNPIINIVLPREVQDITVKSINILYMEEFKIESANLIDEDGQKTIQIVLQGEQTKYTNEINQATIVITADLTFGMLTPSSSENVILNYTNENGTNINYSTSGSINVEAKYGLMMYTQMEGYNEAQDIIYTIDDNIPTGKLEAEKEEKTITVRTAVVNNYETSIENVEIVGRVAQGGSTIEALLENVTTNIADARVVYSSNKDAKAEDSTWVDNKENAKSFKIIVGKIEKGKIVQIDYTEKLPANIEYVQSLYTGIEAQYMYLGNTLNQSSTIKGETENLVSTVNSALLNNVVKANVGEGLVVATVATSGGETLKEGDSVYEGQSIKYAIQISNNTGADLNNVKVEATQVNGKIYDLEEIEVKNYSRYKDSEIHIEHIYALQDTNKKIFDTIEKIANGESVILQYEIVVDEIEGTKNTSGEIKISADSQEDKTINTISNNIEQAEVDVKVLSTSTEELNVYAGQVAEVKYEVKNISESELKNLHINIQLPEGVHPGDQFYSANRRNSENIVVEDTRVENVRYNDDENIIMIDISEINSDENVNIVCYLQIEDFETETKQLTFNANVTTESGKVYVSNDYIKTIKNPEKGITITQETNVNDDKVLEVDENFEIILTANNNSSSDFTTTILDELPICFTVTKATVEYNNVIRELPIVQYTGEDLNIETTSYVYENTITGGTRIIVTQELKEGEQAKIRLNLKVNTFGTETAVINKATIQYGNTIEWEYVNESKKTFNVKIVDNTETVKYVEVTQSSNVENNSKIINGQEIVYTANIKNISAVQTQISVKDTLPDRIKVKKIMLNNEDITEESLITDNNINLSNYTLESGQEIIVQITTIYENPNELVEKIRNIIYVETISETVESNEIVYYFGEDEEPTDPTEPETPDNPNTPDTPSNPDSPSTPSDENNPSNPENKNNKKYTISGLAWLDQNRNGRRETNETLLSSIQVKLIDEATGRYVQVNELDLSTRTSQNGEYTFEVGEGRYIVVFNYNTEKYSTTEYKKDGVQSEYNSDAVNKTITVNGVRTTLGATDTIVLSGSNITNIDLGLIENKLFDLELNKSITKITVQNKAGTNTYTYDNSKLAKVEIPAKQLNNSIVIIEYQIKVTNTGEVAGYVRNIVDNIPTELKFSSELNKDWYLSGSKLYNTSLANTLINSGESKTLSLILTKTMTENNTGRVSNTAEIAEATNTQGINDKDSTPGNSINTEDDFSVADAIISVKTGALVAYTGVIIAIILSISILAYVINRKILKEEKEF